MYDLEGGPRYEIEVIIASAHLDTVSPCQMHVKVEADKRREIIECLEDAEEWSQR